MKKQKNNLTFLVCAIFFASLFFIVGTSQALAYGGATVSWTAPETDEGEEELTGLSGYRVYYSTSAIDCTAWDGATVSERRANEKDEVALLPATYKTVSGGLTTSYAFGGTLDLSPGSTYNFAVVAYDDNNNLSKCAVTTGSATYVSKAVTFSADIDVNGCVNYLDYGSFHPLYGSSSGDDDYSAAADFNKDGDIGYLDYGILHTDYNEGTCVD